MNALPSLNGSVGYIFTSCDLDVKGSNSVRFKDMIDRFKVYDAPRRPEGREEVWQGGERVDTRDYLLYGRIYVPTARLDALYSTRLSRSVQLSIAGISTPPTQARSLASGQTQRQQRQGGSSQADPSNVMVSLQHDTGRWCSEYSWSANDGMWGARVLHNFGRLADDGGESGSGRERVKRVDEEDAMEGGLKGRFSAGAEVYFSAREKSGGVSTGLRFTTLPDATPPSFQVPSSAPDAASTLGIAPSQPPTTLTATYNPIMGHLSTAYAARVSRDLSLCSRFDFNIYSYESEWTMGAEWWMRRGSKGKEKEEPGVPQGLVSTHPALVNHETVTTLVTIAPPSPGPQSSPPAEEVQGVVKARVSTNTVRTLFATVTLLV
ncbi:Mitochondrial distribution and morphology protein 10 [Tulasnella sp. 424]|nr:Mitochondrial distribution and morphology protein 10 [Tulasnella sp. 424]